MSLFKIIHFCILALSIKPTMSQLSFMVSECASEFIPDNPKSTCTSNNISCQAFIVYRAQKGFNTLSSIASLFSVNIDQLQVLNKLSPSNQDRLRLNREVLIPAWCSCSDSKFFTYFQYNASQSRTPFALACNTFEGLVEPRNLRPFSERFRVGHFNDSSIDLPVTCSCPNTTDLEKGIKYLVTYPILENDGTDVIALKFEIPEEMIWEVNAMDPFNSIYPGTTLFVPLNNTEFMDFDNVTRSINVTYSPPIMIPPSGFVTKKEVRSKYIYLMLGILVFVIVLLIIVMSCTLVFAWIRKRHGVSAEASGLSRFPKEFLDGMSELKHSFTYYSLEELSVATGSFSEDSAIAPNIHKGKMGDSYYAIKQVKSREEANSIICILAKINHLNVVKLTGFCDGTTPYLVFQFVENQSLRECLLNSDTAKQLTWKRRIQIASDIAEGLHYLHYCTKPTYLHRNINSGNVLVSADWRAKISGFGSAKPIDSNEEDGEINATEPGFAREEGYFAPEYINHGQASAKLDVYAYGIVLLELLAGKEAITNTNHLKDFLMFTSTPDSCGYMERLGNFIDPVLGEEFPMTEVLYLAFLAKGCTEENPDERPTMTDVLKALSKIS